MAAVISLPHEFTIHYVLADPVLEDAIQSMPFATPGTTETPCDILIVDNVDSLHSTDFKYAILLDAACFPAVIPDNTILLQELPGENLKADLISIITTINQGNAHSLLRQQASYSTRLDWLTHGLEEAIIWTNEKFEILAMTDRTASLFKLTQEHIQGRPFLEVVRCEEEDLHEMLLKRAAAMATDKLELAGRLQDGTKIYLKVGIRPISHDRYQLNLVDVSSQRAADKRFLQLANYDPLTGLANRGLLYEFLQHAMARSKRNGRLVAILLLELDHFNRVSAETGAQMGDELLKNASGRIKHLLNDHDMLARWGGDELAIVMEDLEHPDTVSRIATKILSVLSNPVVLDGQDYYVSPSIGIAVYPDADETLNGLIQAANTAMFEAKKSEGKYNFRFYQAKLQKVAEQRALMELHLRRALDNQEFKLFYQPKVSISQEKVIGFEALLRWQHPEWNNVSPAEYIPVAEQCGLIGQIGDWVLRQACTKMSQWQQEFPQMSECSIAVNVSPIQLNDPYFASRIAAILAESHLAADRLEIELTESAVMENPEQGIRILKKIHELGVKISIDDFGTGYSSLSYLTKLPIDCIKIDRSFVIDIGLDKSTESIIQAILVMSSKLGLINVAEGIETIQQMAFFEGTHCDILQGYMFSKPRSEEDISSMFTGIRPALHKELSQLGSLRA